jgi:hypothetical protein
MQAEPLALVHIVLFVVALLAVIAVFLALDALAYWRHLRRNRAENRLLREHERRYWRRKFIWSVFSTRRVPRLTDRRDTGRA